MYRAPYGGGAPPPYGGSPQAQQLSSQDARANLAVQPTANAEKVKLKKSSVKIVSSAKPPMAPAAPAVPAPSTASLPTASQLPAMPLPNESHATRLSQLAPPTAAPVASSISGATASPSNGRPSLRMQGPAIPSQESDIDELFLRLSKSPSPMREWASQIAAPKGSASASDSLFTASRPQASPPKPHASPAQVKVSMNDIESLAQALKLKPSPTPELAQSIRAAAIPPPVKYTALQTNPPASKENHNFLRSFLDDVSKTPSPAPSKAPVSTNLVHQISQKVGTTFDLAKKVHPAVVDGLKLKYGEAIVAYVKTLPKNSDKTIDPMTVGKVLHEHGGDLLQVFLNLAQQGLVSFQNFDDLNGICTALRETRNEEMKKLVSSLPSTSEGLPSSPERGFTNAQPSDTVFGTRRPAFGKRCATSVTGPAPLTTVSKTVAKLPESPRSSPRGETKKVSVPEPFIRAVANPVKITRPPDMITSHADRIVDTAAQSLSSPPQAAPSTPDKGTNSYGSLRSPPQAPPVDPMDKVITWPTQEKRQKSAGSRVAILRGIPPNSRIYDIQSLVWGGALENIMFDSNRNIAHARFFTAESCQKFFEDTANGIEVPGKNRLVIFVDQAPGPHSVNDVLQASIERHETRCVCALQASTHWKDEELRKLAEGKNKLKRQIDVIKRGKNFKGVNYIEFRFTNLVHALNFSRELRENEEWEECVISFAEDPCEIANGVHFGEVGKEAKAIYG
ncbi:hypothetical protein P154DRAFT_520460 [Amniculicola lignicola CBS 123094]|uniref:RRM domain-containing protein n=1 Tax=Amniculicola lignicola CBS 123094 TaxID=1392246 RepID=A0A6A5WZZ2_9PLEO|nr:hypothetical protein P154DRAFT_520460 [Amniculicola lignicola CBS 123094]